MTARTPMHVEPPQPPADQPDWEPALAATDWTSWLREAGEVFHDEPDRLAAATLEQCSMLLIAHVRADRFSEGHLLDTLRSGHLAQLLHRIREPVDQDA